MNTLSYKTVSIRNEDVQHDWHVIDAEGLVIGRMCTKVASILRGKHKASYTPHIDNGDNVIVINADKAIFTGKKMSDKYYLTHSGYPGGQKKFSPKELLDKKPTAVIERAVRGMLPKNKLGRQIIKKLYVYAENEHPHQAQQPKKLEL